MGDLTETQRDVLNEIVHDVASQSVSNAINGGEQEQFLTSYGWTESEILAEIERRA